MSRMGCPISRLKIAETGDYGCENCPLDQCIYDIDVRNKFWEFQRLLVLRSSIRRQNWRYWKRQYRERMKNEGKNTEKD